MSTPDAQAQRNRVKLLLIIGLFLLPPIAAWLTWQYVGSTGVEGTTNAGTLVSPARPLDIAGLSAGDGQPLGDAVLRGRWTYVMFASNGCDARCAQQLYLTRQIRLGVNKDMPRVQRLLVLDDAPAADLAQTLASEHADLVVAVRGDAAAALLERFRGDGFAPDGAQCFLVDPLGNLMMFYDPGVPPKGMIKDLRKLLKVSQIG
ncbi:MAG: hypothetical protein QNJ91_06745 [Gammaproteobacteria bacterium]|nr:hypothetical protein [Gammaproteobacteria bacterium]